VVTEDSSLEALADVSPIKHIGKAIGPDVDGIEAGLYCCTPAVFEELQQLQAAGRYFTVANAMQSLATKGKLGAAFTAGSQ
jgi:hypothetical protein